MRAGERPLRSQHCRSTCRPISETGVTWVLEDFQGSPQKDSDFDPWEPLYVLRPRPPKPKIVRTRLLSPRIFGIQLLQAVSISKSVSWTGRKLRLPSFVRMQRKTVRLSLRAPNRKISIQRARCSYRCSTPHSNAKSFRTPLFGAVFIFPAATFSASRLGLKALRMTFWMRFG